MNFTQADLPHIKWSLTTFLVVLAIGGSAVFLGQKYADSAQKSKRSLQQQLNEARNKLNAAREDLQNMATYTREFSTIQRRGILGDEKRLNMIEDLTSLRSRNLVIDFKYGISPQQPYKPVFSVDSGNYDLKLSPMTMQLELLHEGQLIRFFDSLRKDAKGWFILDKCNIERMGGTAAQLKADCAGGWLTLKNRNSP